MRWGTTVSRMAALRVALGLGAATFSGIVLGDTASARVAIALALVTVAGSVALAEVMQARCTPGWKRLAAGLTGVVPLAVLAGAMHVSLSHLVLDAAKRPDLGTASTVIAVCAAVAWTRWKEERDALPGAVNDQPS